MMNRGLKAELRERALGVINCSLKILQCSQNYRLLLKMEILVGSRIFSQVLDAWFLVEVVYGKMLVARRLTLVNARARKGKRCARVLSKTIRYP